MNDEDKQIIGFTIDILKAAAGSLERANKEDSLKWVELSDDMVNQAKENLRIVLGV